MPSVGRSRAGEEGPVCSLTSVKRPRCNSGATRRTAFNSDDHLKVLSKVLGEVFVKSPQKDVHLKQDLVQLLRHRRRLHVYVSQKPLNVIPTFGVGYPDRAAVAVGGIKTTPAPRILVVTGKRRAGSSAGVEKAGKENDDEAISDTPGSACYGRGEKARGTQVVYGGKEEGVRRGGIGEGHVDILRCRRDGRVWESVVGH